MRATAAAPALFVAALALGGCSASTNDPAYDALLRLPTGQFFRGKPPTPGDGPAVTQLSPSPGVIHRGPNDAISGFVARTATSVVVYVEGDVGYWVVTPGQLDPSQLDQLGFSAGASYAATLPAGSYTIDALAADIHGHFGPLLTTDIKTDDMPSTDTLLVSLSWDVEADLDLHLVTPDGTEVSTSKINSLPPPVPGQPGDPNGYKDGGILDYDSNANCVIDGRRQENVFWTVAPPSGHYLVRVDTYSMCGEAQANWSLAVTLDSQSLGLASGRSHDSDAAFAHGVGAGVKALEFDIP
ncbi:MAG: hypothetical protein JWM53_1138 [bacterium]|nr:hypothetical protein [bacterium]